MKSKTKPSRYLGKGRNAEREEDEEDEQDKEGIDGMTAQEKQTIIGKKRRIKGIQRVLTNYRSLKGLKAGHDVVERREGGGGGRGEVEIEVRMRLKKGDGRKTREDKGRKTGIHQVRSQKIKKKIK